MKLIIGDHSFDPNEVFLADITRSRRILIQAEGGGKNTRVAEGKQQRQRVTGHKLKSQTEAGS